MAIAASTPSAVRWSGLTRPGRRRAIHSSDARLGHSQQELLLCSLLLLIDRWLITPPAGSGYTFASASATTRRSPANASRSSTRLGSSGSRRIADGWIVAVTIGARSESSSSPRCWVTREGAAEQRLGRGGAEQHQRLGPHDLQLLLEPRLAGVDLEALRGLVDAAAPALLELEVLDHVGQVGVLALDAGRLEPAVELPARGAHERLARAVLLVARLLAHEHEPRGLPPLAEHGLGRGRARGGSRGSRPRPRAAPSASGARAGTAWRRSVPARPQARFARVAGPLLVVDAPSMLFRAFYALPDTIKGADGQPGQRAARHREPDPARGRAARAARRGALLRPRRRRLPGRAVRRLPRGAPRGARRARAAVPRPRARSSRRSAGSWPTATRSRPTTCSARTPRARPRRAGARSS